MGVEATALYFVAPHRVELRREEIDPTGDQVLVRSRLIGISQGTEMLAFHGHLPKELPAGCGSILSAQMFILLIPSNLITLNRLPSCAPLPSSSMPQLPSHPNAVYYVTC